MKFLYTRFLRKYDSHKIFSINQLISFYLLKKIFELNSSSFFKTNFFSFLMEIKFISPMPLTIPFLI